MLQLKTADQLQPGDYVLGVDRGLVTATAPHGPDTRRVTFDHGQYVLYPATREVCTRITEEETT